MTAERLKGKPLLYLLDADTLIRADREAYPLSRFPVLWNWLLYQGDAGRVKITLEQYEEIAVGTGALVDWLSDDAHRQALLLPDDVDLPTVQQVLNGGYAPDLDEDEVEKIGRDPFLVAHAMAVIGERTVVTFEVSASSKQRANRKLPDVCAQFDVPCMTVYDLIKTLDFSMGWQPP